MTVIFISRKGLRNLILASLLGGVFVGFVMFIADRIIDWLYVPSLVAGIVGALVMSRWIYNGRINNLIINIAFAVLMSLVIYGTYQLTNYLVFRSEAYETIARQYRTQVNVPNIDAIIDGYLKEETGSTGFIGYVELVLERGVTITSELPQRQETLTGQGAFFHLLANAGIVMALIVLAAYKAAKRPYCSRCHSFYGHTFFNSDNGTENLGNVDIQYVNKFLSKLQAKQFSEAGKFIHYERYSYWLEIEIDRCKTCIISPLYLKAKAMSRMPALLRKALYYGKISVVDYYDLKESRPE